MDIVVIVLDLMHLQNFHCQLVNRVKMLLFLMWTIAYQSILIKDILLLGEGPADELDNNKIKT